MWWRRAARCEQREKSEAKHVRDAEHLPGAEQRSGRLDLVRRHHLIMIGVFHAIAGLAGIIENEFYSVVPAAGTEATGDVYFLQFDATTWGWIHLIGGLIVLFAGSGCSGARSGLGPSA